MTRTIAWTGGSKPAALRLISSEERQLTRNIFRAAMAEVRAYWGDYRGLNATALDMARVQWKRARYDAHATLRD